MAQKTLHWAKQTCTSEDQKPSCDLAGTETADEDDPNAVHEKS
jgi:hypothetical protein